MLQQEESEIGLSGGNGQLLTLGLGLLATALAATYVTKLAKVDTSFSHLDAFKGRKIHHEYC